MSSSTILTVTYRGFREQMDVKLFAKCWFSKYGVHKFKLEEYRQMQLFLRILIKSNTRHSLQQ